MTKRFIHCAILLTLALCLSESIAQAQKLSSTNQESNRTARISGGLRFSVLLAQARPATRAGFALMPSNRYGNASGFSVTPMAGPNLPVMGSGTVGRLAKWTGLTSSNSFIGNSTIFEDKFGAVGIGTDTPTSRLTVAGVIESTTGGFKFPDGTEQTTSAAGSLFTVAHDATLVGDGTIGLPLGVAVPLKLTGSINMGGIIEATNNTDEFGSVIVAKGGFRAVAAEGRSSESVAGDGVSALGGSSDGGSSGTGLSATGGFTDHGIGGEGVRASGANSSTGTGGDGVFANGGSTSSGNAGAGVRVIGGSAVIEGNGGHGFVANGGSGRGSLNSAGHGIVARQGFGSDGAADGLAGLFNGDVEVSGNLNVTGTKNFKIDHPLDPENKYLIHAAIESSEVLNVYSGNVTTNHNGEAVVTLPEWFEALNRDLRYQLTVIGTFAQAIIAEKVKGNRFIIRTNAPDVEVSWQVTGVRSDASMKKHAFKAEQEKPSRERGTT